MTLRLIPALVVFAAPVVVFGQDTPPPGAPAAAEKRTLTFHRPETKGTKYEFTSEASQTRSTDLHFDNDVEPRGNESIEVKLSGVFEVTEVSPKAGNITAYSFTVKKMTIKDPAGDGEQGFESGTVVTAKVGNFETTWYADGGEVTGVLKEGLLLALPNFYGVDEPVDEALDTKEPVAKGDKWKPDMVRFSEMIKKHQKGTELDGAKSTAQARYKGPATVGGVEADVAVVSLTFVYSKIPGLPEGAKLISGERTVDTTLSQARDAKISAPPEMRSVTEEKTLLSAKHEEKEYEIEFKGRSERHMTMKPVK